MQMIKDIKDGTQLNNGIKMPWLGFGVFQIKDGQEVEDAVKCALETGYHSIESDCGEHYPTVRNITMENVTAEKAPRAFYFQGIEALPIQNVTVRNCVFNNLAKPSVMSGIATWC